MNLLPNSIDIFCRVIDNFGDIGVCWRLAQSLPSKSNIRLWVDDLNSFHRIEPELDPSLYQQQVKGIEVNHWHPQITDWQAADLVIEAFACDLPEGYLKVMKGHTRCWLNLDYLSAEEWVENFHLQPSIQPNGVPKYFFFPGFNDKTGGLLRHHKALQNKQEKNQFLADLLPAECYAYYQDKDPLLINLFCYTHAPISALLDSLPKERAIMIIVAESVAPQLESMAAKCSSNAYIQQLNFIVQTDYDCLLQAADINLIRGEDSFVQAHWAQKPMLWHIYAQDEDYHLVKLNAWLEAINAPLWLQQLNTLWNRLDDNCAEENAKQELIQLLAKYAFDTDFSVEWSNFQKNLYDKLNQLPTLSQQIINFYEECLKKS
ncbi:MAG: elongation factor P maturation arginine rhamnosyltransferase EarP [Alcaligenaceae bacterium]|nr:elongation factor P maturation arginine rhamnosyltransferase EarP [Alcaligenaceae bacterium]